MKKKGHYRDGSASFFVFWQIIWLKAKKVVILPWKSIQSNKN
jgi:hypothetical protein